MAQFRLTDKMAKKLGIDKLVKPKKQGLPFYDDWVIDIVKIKRKDIVIVMHVETRLAFAIALTESGGIQSLFESIDIMMRAVIGDYDENRDLETDEVIKDYFDTENEHNNFDFCKTEHKSVLAHIKQFKDTIEITAIKGGGINQIICDAATEKWIENTSITNPTGKKEWITPIELWHRLFDTNSNSIIEGEFETIADNIIQFPSGGTS